MKFLYLNRDISWLSFNKRVLDEAREPGMPVMERVNFLSIFSSNLDEFYRVRMPALKALTSMQKAGTGDEELVRRIEEIIQDQLTLFGEIIKSDIIPTLKKNGIELIYKRSVPSFLKPGLTNFFFNQVAAYIRIVDLDKVKKFFPENNRLYILAVVQKSDGQNGMFIVNIPSENLPRFYPVEHRNKLYVMMLDDIIRINIPRIIQHDRILSLHNFKVTRSGELDIEDEFAGDIAQKIERELARRDQGLATRFLYEGSIKKEFLKFLKKKLRLRKASIVKGDRYHNLSELRHLPVQQKDSRYKPWPQVDINFGNKSIFDAIASRPFILHTPYQSFDPLLRFFNEASVDHSVTAIYTTIYRIAKNSMIANALVNAARNGKKVRVFVELKARFDEENNLKWARKMENAGVKIIFSIPGLKVHSKVALVKRQEQDQTRFYGIIGTGNFHEDNALLYADHYLFTIDRSILTELNSLFDFLRNTKKGSGKVDLGFQNLLVGQFNLRSSFVKLVENEIDNAHKGLPSAIILKMNNLEDVALINALYIASEAGVKIFLLVRGICCLMPGVEGMSSNIKVIRIVDRYLEHGRVMIFNNNNNPAVYLGSSDWMTRNMERRIEVCVPIGDENLRNEIIYMVNTQLADNQKAVLLDAFGENKKPKRQGQPKRQSQKELAMWFSKNKNSD